MEVRVISRSNKELLLEIRGENHTLGNMLMKEAIRHPGVEYAAYRVLHPLKDTIEFVIVVKEGEDLSTVLRDIIDKLRREITDFKQAVEKVLGNE